MKNTFVILLLLLTSSISYSQDDRNKVVESRCKELVRVIGVADREVWKKFIIENYTQELINKPVRTTIQGGMAGGNSNSSESMNSVEGKANMYQRMHDDVGQGKIKNIKIDGEKVDVEVETTTGTSLNFALKFQLNSPYLIDGFSVQMMMGR